MAQDVTDWSQQFVPFAADDFGNLLFVDQRPGPQHGAVGQWENADLGRTAVWASLAAALDAVGNALDNGGAVELLRPFVDSDGALRWG